MQSEQIREIRQESPYHEPIAKVGSDETGPSYVEGAEPSDTLAVRIEYIEFTRDWAVSCLVPYFGGLTSSPLAATLQNPLPERVWKYRLEGNVARRGDWEIPVRPFVGISPH
jgi:acetamidase/formamidase